MSKKKEKIYRIIESYREFYVQKYIPPAMIFWIFESRPAEWESVKSYGTVQEAMAGIRRLQKYESPNVLWQTNVDELDLEEALSDE